ncbi:MAG: hypothetical protein CUN56_09690 [Phototrophicales bacterium]|nr:MAG: hypothetical protein CUN56_09690 [Phototrophicales bacterium]
MIKRLIFLFTLSFLVAACQQNQDTELPTRFIVITADPAVVGTSAVVVNTPDTQTTSMVGNPTLPPSWTPTPSLTASPTVSVTPSNTITVTPSRTPTLTLTPTVEVEPLSALLLLAAQATIQPPPTPTNIAGQPTVPPLSTQPPNTVCQYAPPSGFGTAVAQDASITASIGCPVGAPPVASNYAAATQNFERGAMIWTSQGTIYVLFNDGTYQQVVDTFDPAVDPESGGEIPPAGLVEPIRGFGKVWRTVSGVKDRLGWALTAETATNATVQEFLQGRMMYLPIRGDILILTNQGTWRAVAGSY